MEKTIYLGDKEVHLTSSAATPLIYKSQFKSDFFGDMLKMAQGLESANTKKDDDKTEGVEIDIKSVDLDKVKNFDLTILYNFIWALAKNNDTETPEPLSFFSQFESINLESSMPAVQDLMMASIGTTKK